MKSAIVSLIIVLTLVILNSCQNNQKIKSTADDITQDTLIEYSSQKAGNKLYPKGELGLKLGFENDYYLQNSDSEYVYMYISFNALKKTELTKRSPLNIAVVFDKSGSMSDEGKLGYAIKAGELIVDHLQSTDKLALVAYDHGVITLQPSTEVVNKPLLKDKIKKLQPMGSTNLSGGMLEGYAQAKKSFNQNSINRVLLLSDGLANAGVIDLNELEKMVAQKFENHGMAISTFGVGVDYNEDLLTNLAEYGKGNYYYIDAPDKIPGIFETELQGLLSVVMQNATLKIEYPEDHVKVENVFGHDFHISNNMIEVKLNDVFSEEEKAILINFKRKKKITSNLKFDTYLTYDDVNQNYEREEINANLVLRLTKDNSLYVNSYNEEVLRNKVVFLSNDMLSRAAIEVDNGNYDKARKMLQTNTSFMKEEFEVISADSLMMLQLENNNAYLEEVDHIEEKSEFEKKMMQKLTKDYNYRIRKKKGY